RKPESHPVKAFFHAPDEGFVRMLFKTRLRKMPVQQCRYDEVIFTGIFSQLALPTSIHRLTGVTDVKTPMVH
ncbi:hypothetical protein M1710_16830, partial [Salmonella enterica subsp. enterica serovar Soahanina]|nr:hypothetical protein [Salmonella enterica subsp. enterica serovar Soahanina]